MVDTADVHNLKIVSRTVAGEAKDHGLGRFAGGSDADRAITWRASDQGATVDLSTDSGAKSRTAEESATDATSQARSALSAGTIGNPFLPLFPTE